MGEASAGFHLNGKGEMTTPHLKDSISTFYIEITNACNLACTFCPYPKMNRKKGVMTLNLFKKVVDEVAEKEISSWICLHLMGEPTLHPQFFEMVRYLNDKDLHVSLITNGSIPADQLARGFYGLKIAALNLSVNSFGEEQYTLKGVKHMDYEQYVENQKKFIDIYTEHHPSTPIHISYLLTKNKYMPFDARLVDTDDEMRSVLRYWMDYAEKFNDRGDAFLRQARFVSKSEPLNEMKILTPEDLHQKLECPTSELIFRIAPTLFVYFKSAGTWHNQLLDEGMTVEKRVRATCRILETEFAVLWNGDTTFCCGDYEGKMQLGNVCEQSIEEILRSEKVTRIREDNKKMILNQEVCQVCKGTVYEKDGHKIDVDKVTLSERFKIAREYFERYGSNAFMRKVISKLPV